MFLFAGKLPNLRVKPGDCLSPHPALRTALAIPRREDSPLQPGGQTDILWFSQVRMGSNGLSIVLSIESLKYILGVFVSLYFVIIFVHSYNSDLWKCLDLCILHVRGDRGSITSGWKEEESCTSEWFCVLGRGLPSPKTQNHSRVQDSSSFHPRVIEPVSPTMKRRNLHALPWG